MKFKYAYVVIRKADNAVIQTIKTTRANWSVDNATMFSIQVPVDYVDMCGDKYYYDGQWWVRTWSTVDEYGDPVEGATYIDTPWIMESEV